MVLPNPGIEPGSPTLQVDSSPAKPPGMEISWRALGGWTILTQQVGGRGASPVAPVVKNPPVDAGDISSIPGSEGSSGVGNDNPLECACLGNPIGTGAWKATVHGVARSQT